MVESILLDTVALWGLVFVNSRYHRQVVKAIKGKHIFIHSICFHELVYPAYKLESDGGRNVREGLKLIRSLARTYTNVVEKHRILFNVDKLTIVPLTVTDLVKAYELILEERETFIEERKGYWPSIVDAIVASLWEKLKVKLLTDDEKLIEYGRKRGLPYLKIPAT